MTNFLLPFFTDIKLSILESILQSKIDCHYLYIRKQVKIQKTLDQSKSYYVYLYFPFLLHTFFFVYVEHNLYLME